MSFNPDGPGLAVQCGCLAWMKPDIGNKPHGFRCPVCGGCCDVQILNPKTDHRTCGVYVTGLRCGARLKSDESMCRGCAWAAVDQVIGFPGDREKLLNRFGEEAVRDRSMELARSERHRKAREESLARVAWEAARTDDASHVVYYARLGRNHIKIGTTNRLPKRMAELRVVNPTNLLAAEPGGYTLERERHEQFRKWRYNRRKEDFGEGTDLLEHITTTRAEHGDPYVLAARLLAETSAPQ